MTTCRLSSLITRGSVSGGARPAFDRLHGEPFRSERPLRREAHLRPRAAPRNPPQPRSRAARSRHGELRARYASAVSAARSPCTGLLVLRVAVRITGEGLQELMSARDETRRAAFRRPPLAAPRANGESISKRRLAEPSDPHRENESDCEQYAEAESDPNLQPFDVVSRADRGVGAPARRIELEAIVAHGSAAATVVAACFAAKERSRASRMLDRSCCLAAAMRSATSGETLTVASSGRRPRSRRRRERRTRARP